MWVPNIVSPHATWAYSWIRPTSRSRRRTRILAPAAPELWPDPVRASRSDAAHVTNLAGRITFVSDPVPGNQHDLAMLKGSECEVILCRPNTRSRGLTCCFGYRSDTLMVG